MRDRAVFFSRNFCGAFADAAVLLPVVALLITQVGMSVSMLLLTAGVIYIIAGFYFKIPMAVQPLKSLAIAGIASGISVTEMKISTLIFGLTLTAVFLLKADRFLQRVPDHWIRCVQLGLGILLMMQAWPNMGLLPAGLVLLMLLGPKLLGGLPVLGLTAVIGFSWALLHPSAPLAQSMISSIPESAASIRWMLLLSLILPQLVLTSANSILGTIQVAHAYFPTQSQKVTSKKLIEFIGIGNILTGLIGGLPFCHGAGGFTAHVRGGANHWVTNVIIGSTLVLLGLFAVFHSGIVPQMNPFLISALLFSTGLFHAYLAKPLLKLKFNFVYIAFTVAMTLLTKNLLFVLLAVMIFDQISLFINGEKNT